MILERFLERNEAAPRRAYGLCAFVSGEGFIPDRSIFLVDVISYTVYCSFMEVEWSFMDVNPPFPFD